jgi:hypothetical protein
MKASVYVMVLLFAPLAFANSQVAADGSQEVVVKSLTPEVIEAADRIDSLQLEDLPEALSKVTDG